MALFSIPLTKGKIAIVDKEDYEYLNQFKWFYVNEYAGRNSPRDVNGNQKRILMHRIIVDCPKNKEVDHINGNGLDNRKQNLRICTRKDNSRNRKKIKKSSSKYKGVSWWNRDKKWTASIKVNQKTIFLGQFKDEKEAANAYNEAAIEYFGKFAMVNVII